MKAIPVSCPGEVFDHRSASSLKNDINSGLGRWSEEELVDYLKIGKNRHGTAFGTMVEVINNSTRYMSDEDLRAMAAYLKSFPSVKKTNASPYNYDPTVTNKLTRREFDQAGADICLHHCFACHMYDGKGQSTYQPPLAGNPVVLDPDPSSLINLVLNGLLRLLPEGIPETYDMPHFRVLLDDQKIADVLNFNRNSWGNSAPSVTSQHVRAIRGPPIRLSTTLSCSG